MDRKTEIKILQETIKKLMSVRNLTLKHLAQRLGVSIATAKRILNQDDLSFDRTLEICDWLGIGLKELVDMAHAVRGDYFYCSVQQETYLAQHPSHFSVLRLLQKGESVTSIATSHNIPPNDLLRYLADLEINGFLRLTDQGQYEVIVKDGMDWRPDGPLRAALMAQWVTEAAALHAEVGASIDISQRKLRPETAKQMMLEIDAISRKYAALSRFERELCREDDLSFYTCVTIAAPKVAPMWKVQPYRRNLSSAK